MKNAIHTLLCALLLLSGCRPHTTQETDSTMPAYSLLPVTYAQGFRLLRGEGYIRADIINPWDTTSLLHSYILVPRDAELPTKLPQGTLLRTPLTRSLVFASVHCSLLQELGCLDAIGGICDSEYIYIEELQRRLREGNLIDAGNSMSPNVEQIIALHPDAILLSTYENNNYARLEKRGIPIIECADYLENTPLGRAEWMRLFGLLYGCSHKADSLFRAIEADYNATLQRTQTTPHRPTVISERRTGSVWYIPGGKSYMATLFAHAGATYPWSNDNNTGSIPLSFEAVFEQAQKADFWLIKYHADKDLTYSDLACEYAPYTRFSAFEQQKIYGCNTQKIRYYEQTPFHPERLLSNMAAIFHPELFPDYTPHYFHPLAP